jgi:hypothetical protein
MTTYDTVLSADAITAISKQFEEYYQDLDASIYFPLIDDSVENFNKLTYRGTKLQKSTSSKGVGNLYSPTQSKMQTGHFYDDYILGGREAILEVSKTEINNWVPKELLSKKRVGEMRQVVKDIDDQYFFGCYVDPDNKDALMDDGGYITQAATVEDLAGDDSNLATKGYGWKGIKKMIETIPLRYRRSLPNMICLMSENLYNKLSAPDRIYEGAITEMQKIMDQFMAPNTPKQVKIDQIIVTNSILLAADTEGTNDRIGLFIPDPSILARVVTLPLQPIGESVGAFVVDQIWAHRGSLCVFDKAAALLSEQIVYA